MKRTTIALEEDLLRKIKQEAARQGETIAAFLNGLIRKALSVRTKGKPYRLKWKPVRGLIRPGIDVSDRNQLFDIMDGLR